MFVIVVFLVSGAVMELATRLRPIYRARVRREWGLDLVVLGTSTVAQLGLDHVMGRLSVAATSTPGSVMVRDFIGRGPAAAVLVASIIFGDFLFYWIHRLNHVGWLWHTHAVHHSSHHLNWISAARASPIHVLLISIVDFITGFFFHLPPGSAAVALVVLIVNNQLVHSNVRLPWGPLRAVFVTPEHHLIHHHPDPTLNDSNFGGIFIIWDKLFGTYRAPAPPSSEAPNLGINYSNSNWRLIVGLAPPKNRTGVPREA